MDGLSLDGIVEMLRGFMPTISYYLNLAIRLFDIFTSSLGLGVFQPEPENPDGGDANTGVIE